MAEIKRSGARYYEAYADYAKTLRTWLVAYGIGGPVFYATQKDIPEEIVRSGCARVIAILFLVGVFIQIGGALVYKAATWNLHMQQDIAGNTPRDGCWAKRIEHTYLLDIAIDGSTIILFLISTGWVFLILGG